MAVTRSKTAVKAKNGTTNKASPPKTGAKPAPTKRPAKDTASKQFKVTKPSKPAAKKTSKKAIPKKVAPKKAAKAEKIDWEKLFWKELAFKKFDLEEIAEQVRLHIPPEGINYGALLGGIENHLGKIPKEIFEPIVEDNSRVIYSDGMMYPRGEIHFTKPRKFERVEGACCPHEVEVLRSPEPGFCRCGVTSGHDLPVRAYNALETGNDQAPPLPVYK